MYVPRSYAAGVHMPGYGWLVSGGENPKDGLLDTSELQDKATNEFEISVVLPVKVSRHCVVKMNATQIMLIGGTTEAEEASHQTYVMNWEGNRRWTPAANLHTGRHSHVCFLYDHRILVAGGKVLGGNSFGTDSVESYNFARGVWTTFTSLPGPIAGGAYFPWQGYPTVLGGSPNQAMFQCQKDKWFKLEEHLPYKVHYPVLILTKVSRLCPELGSGKH